ncbi:MAG TPA: acetoacetyl-CoA reductase [Stellaceae bacterium]|nr:acetoacetyl-CoA reductase [Stellaceae bacterium]
MARKAIITGGTRGMGAAIAKRFKSAGYGVAAIFYGNAAAAEAFHAETGIPVYRWDVADFDACQAGIAAVCKDLGEPVDILINNAGITRDAMLHKMTAAQWNEVIATDLTSCFNMCRAVIGPMRERGFGRIVNISSINGQKGQLGQTNYSAAKAGILGFTRALALENASKGVTVNAVAAGYVETDMTAAMPQDVLGKIIGQIPVGRLGDPDEIARIVAFLASDDAGFVTGATITANGGQYMA